MRVGRLPGWLLAALLGASLALGACGPDPIEKGDLPALRERGELRILLPPQGNLEALPRRGSLASVHEEAAAAFARSQGLAPRWIRVARFEELLDALVEGRGDLIAANLTVTPDRARRISFTVPLFTVREQLVTRRDDTRLRRIEDLAGRRIGVRRSSSFWETVQALRERVPGLEVEPLRDDVDTEEALYRVAAGELDLTVADSNLVEQAVLYLPQLRVAFDVAKGRAIAWGVRPGAPQLRRATNEYLRQARLTEPRPERIRADLDAIRERRVLRVLTRNSASTYFIWRGEIRGFEYDLARRFADELGVRLEVVVAPSRAALIPWLLEGRGDLIAAGLTILPEREKRGIAFSRPYHRVFETVVARPGDPVARPEDLAGRRVVVRRSSSYWSTLERLRAQGIALELQAAPEYLETEEVVERVGEGRYALTVADSHILALVRTWRTDVRAAFRLGGPVRHGWAVRATDRKLLATVNRFLAKEYRSTFYNVIYERYFGNQPHVRDRAVERATRSGVLSPYDDLARGIGDELGIDWRLLVAQMYQESRFEPEARSSAGALGLLQLMPRTAQELGVDDLSDPEAGLRAGARYLRLLYDRFEDHVPEEERWWFALAAYNAGYGHVRDGQRLARARELDPTRWFGHVERALPLLARRQYYATARFGYCRCSQTVHYVRAVRDRYRAYLQATRAAGVL